MTTETLERALGYPYPIPESSYVVENGTAAPLLGEHAEGHREGRTPVLAVGSNQSPAQIMRKYQGDDWGPIPCEKCTVRDFDTVYSAHITAYGSVAATLHTSPGTAVSLFVNWLTEAQLHRMHATEMGHENYVFARLDQVHVDTEHGEVLDSIYFYRGNLGAFAPNGAPVPLAEVTASRRRWPARTQNEIQTVVHRMTDQHLPFEQFVLSSVQDEDRRHRRRAQMRSGAHPFAHHAVTVLQTKAD